MVDTPISGLVVGAPALGTDEFPAARAGINVKLTPTDLLTFVEANSTGLQAQDALLDDIAALTPAQGEVFYYDGSNIVALGVGTSGEVLTTQGAGSNPVWAANGTGDLLSTNNLSDVANALTATQNLNVEVGVDVQAYDAGLASISGLVTAADTMIYTSALDTYATTGLTAFARTLLDDANQAAMQTTLDVDPSGTDNSTNVSLAGALDYITIVGQAITRNAIDLTTDVTGDLPFSNVDQIATASILGRNTAGLGDIEVLDAATARTVMGVDPAGTDNSTDVTLSGTGGYLVLTGQDIQVDLINLVDDITSTLGVANGGTGAITAAGARTNLGLVIGTDVQAQDAELQNLADITFSQGDVIYHDGFNLVRLGAGTSGEFLQTQGVGANPIWGSSGAGDLLSGNNLSDVADGPTSLSNIGGQPLDAGLTSISGLTTAADTMIYTTALDTYATTSLTAAGRALLDDISAAAQRTTLGLEIGTDVQAQDDNLDDLAALGTVADNEFIVGTGAGTYAFESGATARTSLGVAIGTDVQAQDAELQGIADATFSQGDVIYHNGTTLVNLGPGTAGEVLTTQGAGANPTWSGSGAGDMLLGTSQTVTAAKTFNDSTLLLAGSTSGTTTVNAEAVAAGIIVIPSANDTLVGKATTDTLTNKTFDANGTGNSISNIDVADLANGTDGELITWDAAGAPATVATGSAGEVLTSNGAGTAPTMQALPTWSLDTYVVTTDFTPDVTVALTMVKASSGDNEANVLVFFDGDAQHSTQWGISGTTITFTSAIPSGVTNIEIRVFS